MNLEKKSEFYKALGDPVRLKIIDALLKKECCICEISKIAGRDQSVVFRHIQTLKDAGIVNTCKKGCFLMCCVDKKIGKYLEEK